MRAWNRIEEGNVSARRLPYPTSTASSIRTRIEQLMAHVVRSTRLLHCLSVFLLRLLGQIRDHATAASPTVAASSQTVAPRSRSEGGGVTRSCSAVPFCTAVAGGTATVARRKDHSPGSAAAPCHRMCKFVGQCERRNYLPFNLTVTYRGPQPKRGAVV